MDDSRGDHGFRRSQKKKRKSRKKSDVFLPGMGNAQIERAQKSGNPLKSLKKERKERTKKLKRSKKTI